VFMIGLFIFGLWALTPYLYNREVNEDFPAPLAPAATVMPAAQAQVAQVPAATAAPAAQASPAQMPAAQAPVTLAAPTAMPAPTQLPAAAGPVVLQSGSFIAGNIPGDRAEGKATIYRLEDQRLVVRLEDFAATNGPDLFVVLSRNANPLQDG